MGGVFLGVSWVGPDPKRPSWGIWWLPSWQRPAVGHTMPAMMPRRPPKPDQPAPDPWAGLEPPPADQLPDPWAGLGPADPAAWDEVGPADPASWDEVGRPPAPPA
jgi:hypothetical protein